VDDRIIDIITPVFVKCL